MSDDCKRFALGTQQIQNGADARPLIDYVLSKFRSSQQLDSDGETYSTWVEMTEIFLYHGVHCDTKQLQTLEDIILSEGARSAQNCCPHLDRLGSVLQQKKVESKQLLPPSRDPESHPNLND